MNKQEIIEGLRGDAEWWAGCSPPIDYILSCRIDENKHKWGSYTDNHNQYIYIEGDDVEIWFNLLIAEALEQVDDPVEIK